MKKTFCDLCGKEIPALQSYGSGELGGTSTVKITTPHFRYPSEYKEYYFHKDCLSIIKQAIEGTVELNKTEKQK